MEQRSNHNRVLISGASIAGPALGFWLSRYGFQVTVVEKATTIREGGYKIDVRGTAVNVLKRMGIYDTIKQMKVDIDKTVYVDAKGKIIAQLPADLFGARDGDDVELIRGDLVRILYEATRDNCNYIFSQSIKSIDQTDDLVQVLFDSGESQSFDLVVAADGIHSNTRKLVFGDQPQIYHDLGGYYFAIFDAPNELALAHSEVIFSRPNKLATLYSTSRQQPAKASFLFKIATNSSYQFQSTKDQQDLIRKLYQDLGWQTDTLLKEMETTPEFYFDAIQQIKQDSWSRKRVVLLGDAAWAPSLASGQGTSLAIVGAYVLAAELYAARGDHQQAYDAYERKMRPFVEANQELAMALKRLVPESAFQVWLQQKMMRLLPCLPFSKKMISKMKDKVNTAANGIELNEHLTKNLYHGKTKQ